MFPMKELLKKLWDGMKARGEDIGLPCLIIGSLLVIIRFVLILVGVPTDVTLFALGLALISVGLGFTSVGMSAKSDKRQTDLLERLDRNVGGLPFLLKGDIFTPSGQMVVKELREEQSKNAAQKRLDEDTKRVGYVRGELFQNEDGTWSIHWGGKHPL
jgi:tetrahydromethanopterin S-methyltransferase subunit G